MPYKSTIDLVPTSFTGAEFAKVALEVKRTAGTIAHSVDDALSLTQGPNAAPGSMVRAWNFNEFNDTDKGRLRDSGVALSFPNIDTAPPYIYDARDELVWNDPEHYKIRDVVKIVTATVHHTVGWDFTRTNVWNARNISSYHVNTKGWPGIAYHYLIGPDGEILLCNTLETWSYHAGSFNAPGDENEWSFAICLGGDFRDGRAPTNYQVLAARSLLAMVRRNSPNHINVTPHKQMPGAQTVCPGDNPHEWLRKINGYV